MNLFTYQDYKDLLREQIRVHGSERGYQSRLAEAAGCQRSYLSQVLRGHQHLTLDHGCGMADFWRWQGVEREFFLDLISFNRAGSLSLQKHFQGRLARHRKKVKDLSTRLENRQTMDAIAQQTFYSAWYWSAIHLALNIDGMETAESLSKYLGLRVNLVEHVLRGLQHMGLVQTQDNLSWSAQGVDLHLSKDSPLIRLHHNNWRQKAMQDLPQEERKFQFSAAITHSKKDFEEIQEMIMQLLSQISARIGPSPEEELTCLNIDFFPLGESSP